MAGCIDRRLGNAPRYYLSAPDHMRVFDPILECVAFIGLREGFDYKNAATCFFLSVESKRVANKTFCYVCTARHVVESHLDCGDWVIRVNTKSGSTVPLEGTGARWWYHPTDDTVDFAVMPFDPGDFEHHLDIRPLPTLAFAHKKIIEEENIGVGDEVFMPGLFVHAGGTARNRPIVRSGTIAMMAGEKIVWNEQPMDAHLVEVRSIRGLSGSPVFVRGTTTLINLQSPKPRTALMTDECFYCLGSMIGHWDDRETQSVNMGIAPVVPVEQMAEVLHQPALMELRRQQDADAMRQPGARLDDDST